jgi:hypothetical protein
LASFSAKLATYRYIAAYEYSCAVLESDRQSILPALKCREMVSFCAIEHSVPYRGLPQKDRPRLLGRGMTQLSLVEHALCPLDDQASLKPNLTHSAGYFFTDRSGTRRKATARVLCPEGLSANDELYLWGLLALIFSQPEPSIEFSATPHYCLRQLGLLEDKCHQGGENYRVFRKAIERLSAVTYQNDNFYDPVRSEHCQVSFGFLSYRLPLNSDSSRAWRFYLDPLFFEICQASGSALAFDLEIYRELDTATRRLYLLLKKMFWKRESSMQFDVRHLAINVLGFSASHETWRLKPKLAACIAKLVAHGILGILEGGSVKDLFYKLHKGHHGVRLQRGPNFDRATAHKRLVDSPLQELLHAIGFQPPAVARVLNTYSPKLIAEWADITLAARERNGEAFFKKSAPAYFMDNIRHASAGTRTAPDWWRELRRKEDDHRRRDTAHNSDEALDQYLATEAREVFENVMQSIFENLVSTGQSESDARDRARHIARSNLRAQFLREHPEYRPAETISTPTERDNDE